VRIEQKEKKNASKCILLLLRASLSLSLFRFFPSEEGSRTCGLTSSAACLEEAPSLVSMASSLRLAPAPFLSSLFWFCGGIALLSLCCSSIDSDALRLRCC
jgi:hypothetical protein